MCALCLYCSRVFCVIGATVELNNAAIAAAAIASRGHVFNASGARNNLACIDGCVVVVPMSQAAAFFAAENVPNQRE